LIVSKLSRLFYNSIIGLNLRFLIPFRASLLRLSGCSIGVGVKVNAFVVIDNPDLLVIGDGVSINQFTKISALGGVVIGPAVSIANGVTILSASHQASLNFKHGALVTHKIRIGSNVWIGANSVISNSICENCIIGANSYVNKPIIAPGVYVGNPVRRIREL
jgi:acetyltransferase-like isoleucine patch superfamily enzyme